MSCSQSQYSAVVYPVFLHCSNILNLKILLWYTMSCCLAQLLPSLKPKWALPNLSTSLRCVVFFPWLIYSQSQYISELLLSAIHCWIYSVLINSWDNANLKTMTKYTLSSYSADLLATSKHCWGISTIFHRWATPKIEKMQWYPCLITKVSLFQIDIRPSYLEA